jgi:hypothetical protein
VFRGFLCRGVVVFLALVFATTIVLTAAAQPSRAPRAHRLIVSVKKTLPPAAEKKLAVLILVRRNGAAPAGAVATPSKPLTVLQQSGGVYRIETEIDSACKGSCKAPVYRVSGSADHTLEVVPSCRLEGSSFACTTIAIVAVH